MRILAFLALILIPHLFCLPLGHTVERDPVSQQPLCVATQGISLTQLKGKVVYSPSEQAAIICDALKELSKKYIQTSLVGFNKELSDKSRSCLGAITLDSVNRWGMNSLLKSCAASFNDGHLKVEIKDIAPVFLPFKLEQIEGRFYIASMGYTVCSDSAFRLGDEVLAIDSEPLETQREALKPYISASTEGAREVFAIKALTERSYKLPESGSVQIEVLRSGEKEILNKNWFFYKSLVSGDEESWLVERGYKPCTQDTQEEPEGYSPHKNLYPEVRSQTFYKDSFQDTEIMTLSRPKILGVRSCYLKLSTFSFSSVYHRSDHVDIWHILDGFVKDCSEEQVPFILDLRSNNGGLIKNMRNFVQLFVSDEVGAVANEIVYTRLATGSKKEINCESAVHEDFSDDLHTDKLKVVFCKLLDMNVRTPEGYLGKIYTLSTEHCMSSCDYALAFISSGENTISVGSPSQGAMLITSSTAFSGDFKKPYNFQIFDMAPYYFVGVESSQDSAQRLICSDNGEVCMKQFEGADLSPEVDYTTTYQDLVSLPSGGGWRATVESLIKIHSID